ncbi:MAG TPA: pyruvate dehydrogenase (acetyl-transferring) E1 component subunit alpha [Tepidisphaeraceae bacterium]|jgi:pyruvate dehydrogenase E1 component alpha subunit|nr:pyruvate dehydrogenase (acetyl-transferring) E1 component subunit alpha [Tepidisphaeraceae bacterium]
MSVVDEVAKRPATRKPPESNSAAKSDGSAERARLRLMMLIRRFEERTVQEYQKAGQKIGGFCHVYSGQEAIAVGISAIFQKGKDQLINGYRCHGHSLALGMPARDCFAELFGKATGCSKGKGGSMHFFDAEAGNNGGHGIVGGHIPVGLGLAFAQKYKNTGGVTFCLFGDGAINQGTHNEALNMASLMKAPVIWIVENNGVAMGTQVERSSAEKDLAERGSGYAMPHYHVDGNDVDTVIEKFGAAVERARKGEGPSYIVADTYRFRGHSMSDAMKYRTKDEMEKAKLRDPITLYEVRLREQGLLTQEQIDQLQEEVSKEVADAVAQADNDPHPQLEDRFDDILAEKYPYQPK